MNKGKKEVVTINDIARLSGVAKSTVSRYLNGGSVSLKTGRKIQGIMDETNYSPNSFAQSLKAKKNSLIGIIVPRLDSSSIVESLAGMDEALQKTNYDILISNTYQTHERELKAVETFVKQKVGGIILFATFIDETYLKRLQAIDIPVIVVGQKVSKLHHISYTDYQAGVDIGKHIGELGHQNIIYFGVTEEDLAVGVERKKGIFDGLKNFSVKVTYHETTFKIGDAYELALQVLPEFSGTYVSCATDNIALGVLKAARELGVKVPEDISISGFGGNGSTDAVSPSITTVMYGYGLAGKLAVENVIQLANNHEIDKEIIIPTTIHVKESTQKID